MQSTYRYGSLLRDAATSDSQKKLLLISYHFPPGHSVGALRWEKLSGFAACAGWGMDVVTCKPTGMFATARLAALSDRIRVLGVPERRIFSERVVEILVSVRRSLRARWAHRLAPTRGSPAATRSRSTAQSDIRFNPFSSRDYLRALNAWVAVERELVWARDAARLARELLVDGKYQALITCGPPHACHVSGGAIARHSRIPHIMDLRDPWSQVERVTEDVASPVLFYRFRRHERFAVRSASLVVMNTEQASHAMIQRHPGAASQIVTVMNGFDEESNVPSRPAQRSTSFRIAFAGTIYLDRDPRPLFRAASLVVRQLKLTPNEFSLEFMGDVMSYDDSSLMHIADDEGLTGFVHTHAAGSREQALSFLSTASMLISLPQDSEMAVPSKIFEYMMFEAWLLAFANPGSATAKLLDGSEAHVVAPTDVEGIAQVLLRCVKAHRRGERPPKVCHDVRFGRREQARKLLLRIEEVVRDARNGKEENQLT